MVHLRWAAKGQPRYMATVPDVETCIELHRALQELHGEALVEFHAVDGASGVALVLGMWRVLGHATGTCTSEELDRALEVWLSTHGAHQSPTWEQWASLIEAARDAT